MRKILVADTAFIVKDQYPDIEFISFFPEKKNDGKFRFTMDLLEQRSCEQSNIVKILNELLIDNIDSFSTTSLKKDYKYLLHPVLVMLNSMFTDRLYRFMHIYKKCSDCSIALVPLSKSVNWTSEISQTWQFNQEIFLRFGKAFEMKSDVVFDNNIFPEFPSDYVQANLLFIPQKKGWHHYLVRLQNKFFSMLEKYSSKTGKFVNLGFGTDRFYFAQKGFFGPLGYFNQPLKINLNKTSKDEVVRNKLKNEVFDLTNTEVISYFEKLFPDLGINYKMNLARAYTDFIIDFLPTGFLEGLENHLAQIEQVFPLNAVAVIGHDAVSPSGLLIGAYAKSKNVKVVGIQHGGHYGYINDMSVFGIEYYHYDMICTWGWTEIDSHLPKCETFPLPNPKLSEKTLNFNYLKNFSSKKDILFFSNLFHRFPHISTCGQSRVDFIDEITSTQVSLMKACAEEGLSVEHKPYSLKFVDLYPDHFRKIEEAGGKNYRLLQSKFKGLSVELIETCKIVLWDQIGSGTLECFTSKIPTIIYWPRLYSRESSWGRELILDLEKQGVVHTHSESLVKEINIFKRDPSKWMSNRERSSAISAFCNKYALNDEHWNLKWKKFLKTL
jgi:hypothetical protein